MQSPKKVHPLVILMAKAIEVISLKFLQNANALKHGFYAKHIPEEFLEIMNEEREANPIDLIWEQIVIQYITIIRAQK